MSLTHLTKKTEYIYDNPAPELLERFPSPYSKEVESNGVIHIDVPEFTSLCPVTGQPDFATIIIDYVPGEWCVESKSLKLYMGSFRMQGEFHEACVQRITDDLVNLLSPQYIRVIGQFTPRGGIPIWPKVEYAAKDFDRSVLLHLL